MLNKEKHIRPDIEGEMEELQRFSQELSRDEGIEVSVDEVIKSLKKSKEQLLTNSIWNVLENTESNEVEEGDWKTVEKIAREYKKTSPKVLKKEIESGDYKRPLIAKLGDRYILMAGNTRLCTAAAMGENPNVFIAKIDVDYGINEKWSEKYKKSIDCNNPKGFSQKAHCQGRKKETKESTVADASGSFVSSFSTSPVKKKIDIIHNIKEALTADASGSYDVPFGDGGKNPLKIKGEKSVKKSRAVKDKNFPKFGGPKGVYIKIKDKCKKFPYCNQGDINSIELLEIDGLKEAIQKASKIYGIPYSEMEKVVLNEINKIFIE